MSYDLNVLVNGNRCKQYFKNGRIFVEAKENSEYVVELKNNSWEKILAVVSVDGLNIIDGKTADENGPGYVLDKYTAQKFYGFQYSQEKVATFKFGAMGAVKIDPATGKPEIDPDTGKEIPLGYAASKNDGSEKNTGVIGVVIWDEVPKPPPPPPPPNPAPPPYIPPTTTSGGSWIISGSYSSTSVSCSWSATSYGVTSSYAMNAVYSSNPNTWMKPSNPGLYGPGRFGYTPSPGVSTTITDNSMGNLLREAIADAKAVRQTALANAKSATSFNLQNMVEDQYVPVQESEQLIAAACEDMDMASFDMETQWGQSRNYKVKETEFERREVIHRFDIYYASRESLLAMGIDLGTERRVSFPESFKSDKYAKPPKGWRG